MNDGTLPGRSRRGIRHTSRIYVVTVEGPEGTHTRLVRTFHPGIALRHVARDLITVHVASQDDLVALTNEGVSVEDARHGKDDPER